MKSTKLLRFILLLTVALMAFAGSASATILTGPSSPYTSTIKAESDGWADLLGVALISCKSTVEGKVEQHGSSTTAGGKISSLSFTECGPSNDVTVKNAGSLEVHTKEPSGNGTVTSSGAEVSVQITSLGITCVYTTNETDIGSVIGSSHTGGTATLDLESSRIPRTGGSIFCGSSAEWTGSYRIVTPESLDVD